MIPGPDYIYECPECGKRISKGSLASGNTFGAKIFSDGKMEAPMLSFFPDLTKCRQCGAFFWLHNLTPVEKIDFQMGFPDWELEDIESIPKMPEPIEWAEFMALEDYLTALEKKVYSNENEELALRQEIWWGFNDRVRAGEQIFAEPAQRAIWEDNLRKFQTMLNPKDTSASLMVAEIHRNLGEFEKCIELLNTLKDPDVLWAVDKIKAECLRGNSLVVRLK